MKTQTYGAILGSLLAAMATTADARDDDRIGKAQRHGRDYTPSHDYRNDHRRDDDRRGNDHRHGDSRHGRHNWSHGSHGWDHSHTVYADVIAVEPIVEYVFVEVPVRDCRPGNTVYYESNNSGPGMILGGVIGGAIGHDIARNSGSDVAVVAGTVLGAMIGHDIGHGRTTVVSEPRVHCETRMSRHKERHVVGYRVKYRYSNRVYHTRTDHDPGARIQITLSLDD